jgi:hypothetical protein
MATLEGILWYWGPTILIAAMILAILRGGLSRQARYFKTQADNSTAQTAEMTKIHQSLERIASALESRPAGQGSASRGAQ